MNAQWLGYLLAGGSLLSFTAAILVTKTASRSIPLNLGFLVATATNVLCAAMAYGVQWLVQPTPLTWNGSALAAFAGAGVLASYLGRWFFYESVVLLGPAKASIFQVSNPLFTALVAWLALGEHLPLSVFAAMFLAIAGLMVISLKPLEARTPLAQTGATLPERSRAPIQQRASLLVRLRTSMLFLGLGSSLAYGLGNVLRGSAIRDWNEPILGGLVGAASGLLMHLLLAPRKRELLTQLRSASRRGIWLFAFLGAMTIAGQILSIGAMRFIPVSVAALVTLCTPLLVIPLSRVFYKNSEKITLDVLLGATLTLAGMAWVVMR